MCVFLSIRADKSDLRKRFNVAGLQDELFKPVYVESAFSFPRWPVISRESPDRISLMHWGLIPGWMRDTEGALKFRLNTVNARAETIYEKPAFRNAAARNHCLVIADGFFEFREMEGRKYPYFIRLKGGRPFAIAGLYENWTNRETGEVIPTFSVITTAANGLLEIIHNRKKRMPVILPEHSEREWLEPGRDGASLLRPFPDEGMEAWTVARILTARGGERNVPEAQEPFEYPELSGSGPVQGSIF